MLPALTHSSIVVASRTVPETDECSLDTLAELADLAYRAGDRASAEYLIRLLYAAHDRRAERAAAQSRPEIT